MITACIEVKNYLVEPVSAGRLRSPATEETASAIDASGATTRSVWEAVQV